MSLLVGLKFKNTMICKSHTIYLISLYLLSKISSNESCCTFELDFEWQIGLRETFRQDFMNKIGSVQLGSILDPFLESFLLFFINTRVPALCLCSVLGHNRPFASLVLS